MEFILEDGVPKYSLKHKGVDVLLPVRLGFEIRGTMKSGKIDFVDGKIKKSDTKPSYFLNRDFELAHFVIKEELTEFAMADLWIILLVYLNRISRSGAGRTSG